MNDVVHVVILVVTFSKNVPGRISKKTFLHNDSTLRTCGNYAEILTTEGGEAEDGLVFGVFSVRVRVLGVASRRGGLDIVGRLHQVCLSFVVKRRRNRGTHAVPATLEPSRKG